MAIELNEKEEQIFKAAEEGSGLEISKLMEDIPAKEWASTLDHLKQFSQENHAGPFPTLIFASTHPWVSENPGEPVTKIDPDSLQVTIGIYPSPNLYHGVIDLKSGEIEGKPEWRNFKF